MVDFLISSSENKVNNLEIPDSFIERINIILSKGKGERIFPILEEFKENGKKELNDESNIQKKEEIFSTILNNIEKLLNNTNYKKIYNSDSSIGKSIEDYNNISSLKNMISIGNDNIEGANCNVWVYFIYNLLNDIILGKNIEFIFVTRKIDNHGLLYFKCYNNIFLYHSDKKHILEKRESIIETDEYINHKNDTNKYINKNINLEIKKNLLSYNLGNKYFKLHKKKGIIFLEIKNTEEKFKGKNKYSKGFYRIIKYIRPLSLYNKNYNINTIREKILKKVKNDNREITEQALKHFNEEKLLYFFQNK